MGQVYLNYRDTYVNVKSTQQQLFKLLFLSAAVVDTSVTSSSGVNIIVIYKNTIYVLNLTLRRLSFWPIRASPYGTGGPLQLEVPSVLSFTTSAFGIF